MSDPNLESLSSVGGFSILGAASRAILSEDRRSIAGFLRGLVMALFVSIMVGLVVQDLNLSTGVQDCTIGIASFIADDILLIILAAAAAIRKDPKEAILNLIEYIFGVAKHGKK